MHLAPPRTALRTALGLVAICTVAVVVAGLAQPVSAQPLAAPAKQAEQAKHRVAAHAGDAVVAIGREASGPPVRVVSGTNSTGATNRAVLVTSGFDSTDVDVVFPRIGGAGGTVTLSPAGGADPPACAPLAWRAHHGSEHVTVRCNVNILEPAVVHVTFTRAVHPEGSFAYAFANQPHVKAYTPGKAYQFATSGKKMQVTRLGAGRYQVAIPHVATAHGAVQVSAIGPTLNTCRVVWWQPAGKGPVSTVRVRVSCGPQWSAPADTPFTITYAAQQDLLGLGAKAAGWLFDTAPAAKQTRPRQWSANGATLKVVRHGLSRYEVTGGGLHVALTCTAAPGLLGRTPFVLHWVGSFVQLTSAGPGENVCALDS